MGTTVKFISDKYGNYLDNYFTKDYAGLINYLSGKVEFTRNVNLGIANGVLIENNFNGDFRNINLAIVEHDQDGTHIYKIIKRSFIKRDLWRITMVKDLVSAKWGDIVNSKVLVSRLGLNRKTFDPLLFIPEPIDLSEVKSEQILLNELENTKSYGYLAIWKRGSLNGNPEQDGGIAWKSSTKGLDNYDILVNELSDLSTYNDVESIYIYKRLEMSVYYNDLNTYYAEMFKKFNTVNNGNIYYEGFDIETHDYFNININSSYFNGNDMLGRVDEKLDSYPFNYGTIGDIYSNVGKIVYEQSTGNYYEIGYTEEQEYKEIHELSKEEMDYLIGTSTYSMSVKPKISLSHVFRKQKYTLISNTPTIDHTFAKYEDLVDQPFQMFYIPIIEDGYIEYNGTSTYRTEKHQIENMLFDLISTYSGENSKLVDVQVIPYSPIDGFEEMWDSDNKILDIGDNAKEVILVDNTPFIIPIFEVKYAQYSLSISKEFPIEDYKVEQKKKYLLTSPSGANPYEISPSKNKGITRFLIDVDLRPYSSLHRIQPVYKGLYGNNYNDTRGLIWQEDMSLTLVSNAYETFKRQNINYLNSFNASINYQKSEQAITHEANWGNFGFDAGKRMTEALVDAGTFAAEAVAQDAWFGVKGGISGAAGAAAIVGGALVMEGIEAGQLAYNNKMDAKLLATNIAHQREQFNYNIGNIKAIPENIEKVSGIYKSNNFVPYIQVFSPTQEEIMYFNDYMDTYGLNIGMMVDLKNKEFNFLQGTIIRYNGVITYEEYEELLDTLGRGVREYGW